MKLKPQHRRDTDILLELLLAHLSTWRSLVEKLVHMLDLLFIKLVLDGTFVLIHLLFGDLATHDGECGSSLKKERVQSPKPVPNSAIHNTHNTPVVVKLATCRSAA